MSLILCKINQQTNKKNSNGQYSSSLIASNSLLGYINYKNINNKGNRNIYNNEINIKSKTIGDGEPNAFTTDKSTAQQTWSYHVLPSLYSVYQKVETA